MKISFTFAFVFVFCSGLALSALIPKQLAGPASEFAERAIPSPKDSSLQSRSAFLEVEFQEKVRGAAVTELTWTGDIFVETPQSFMMSYYAPESQTMKVTFRDVQGNEVNLAPYAHQGTHPINSYKSVPTVTYIFNDNSLVVGKYTLEITTTTKLSKEKRVGLMGAPVASVIYFNDSPLYMHSYLSTYNTDLGKPIGLVTQVSAQAKAHLGAIPEALTDVIVDAWMDVFLPDGNEVDVPMYDDGLHGDVHADDGIYAGHIQASEVGVYRAMAVLQGKHSDGTEFLRTTEHLINVIDTQVTFTGMATGEMKDQERMTIYLDVNVPETNSLASFRAYSEVWGKDANGQDLAVCWIASITSIQTVAGEQVVPLEFNLKWASLVGATGPFTLKNAYLIDPYTNIPVDTAAEIPLKTSQDLTSLLPGLKVKEASLEMKQGAFPPHFLDNINTTAAAAGKVILVHGYCAAVNPWSAYASDWTDALFFLNANANIGTQAFSELVAQYANDNGLDYFSVVGHSQGGMVGAHLHNYYFTGMDRVLARRQLFGDNDAAGSRLIQSIGSPFLGCTGAGSAANLAKLFGNGCGENYDLTPDGASTWLSGIGSDSRKQVFYYTTTYKLGNLFGDYCNLAVNAVLEWPNDGVSELVYTKLQGGNNLGNTEKQCHTTDMGYIAQYYDRSRNRVMNDNASR